MLDRFMYLIDDYRKMFTGRAPMIRGKVGDHLKRHHVAENDDKITHYHIFYRTNVTPRNLDAVFRGILHAQENHTQDEYQLIDNEVAGDAMRAFSVYYDSPSAKKIETEEFLPERRLSYAEIFILIQMAEARKGTTIALSEDDLKEIREAGLDVVLNRKPDENKSLSPSSTADFGMFGDDQLTPLSHKNPVLGNETEVEKESSGNLGSDNRIRGQKPS